MKLRLVLAMLSCSCLVHAEEADKQSIYRVSATEPVTLTSTSVRSSLLPNDTRVIRVMANVDAHIVFGNVSATATPSSTFIPAKTPEYFKILPTDGNYVAIVRDSADGKAWIDTMRP